MLDDDYVTQILNAFLLTAGVLMALSAIAITAYQRRTAAEDTPAESPGSATPSQDFGSIPSSRHWRRR